MSQDPSLGARLEGLLSRLTDPSLAADDMLDSGNELHAVVESLPRDAGDREELEGVVQGILEVVERTEADVNLESSAHRLRHVCLQILYQMPSGSVLRSHTGQVLDALQTVIEGDNEENATFAVKLLLDTHTVQLKNTPAKAELVENGRRFIAFIKGVFENMETLVERAFSRQSPPATAWAADSFKTVKELPIAIVYLFQIHEELVRESVAELLPAICNALAVEASEQREAQEEARSRGEVFVGMAESLADRKSVYDEFVTTKVKCVVLLAYVLRVGNAIGNSSELESQLTVLPSYCFSILVSLPSDALSVRRELLLGIRHLGQTGLHKNFIQYVDLMLDERILLGFSITARETMRAMAYNVLADVIHHVRLSLPRTTLARVIHVYSGMLHDVQLSANLWTLCTKLLMNMVEPVLRAGRDPQSSTEGDSAKEPDLSVMLLQILLSFTSKIESLVDCKEFLVDEEARGSRTPGQGSPEREKVALSEADIEKAKPIGRVSIIAETVDHAEIKFLVKNMVQSFRHIAHAYAKLTDSWPDGELVARLAENVIKLLTIFDHGREIKEISEQIGLLIAEADVLTVTYVLESRIDVIVSEILSNPEALQIVQHLLSNNKTSRFMMGTLLSYLSDHLDLLGSHSERCVTLLRLWKMVFLAVTLYPQENEPVMQPYVAHLIMHTLRFANRVSEPSAYFLLLRSLFRNIGGGRFELLYAEVLPLLQTVLEDLNALLLQASDSPTRDIFVELCLTVPVRLSVLLPYLAFLMRPLAIALNSSPTLITEGLRTFEMCVDNLTSGFMMPIVAPVIDDIMHGLYNLLRPENRNAQHAHATMRILGKMGPRARQSRMLPSAAWADVWDSSSSATPRSSGSSDQGTFWAASSSPASVTPSTGPHWDPFAASKGLGLTTANERFSALTASSEKGDPLVFPYPPSTSLPFSSVQFSFTGAESAQEGYINLNELTDLAIAVLRSNNTGYHREAFNFLQGAAAAVIEVNDPTLFGYISDGLLDAYRVPAFAGEAIDLIVSLACYVLENESPLAVDAAETSVNKAISVPFSSKILDSLTEFVARSWTCGSAASSGSSSDTPGIALRLIKSILSYVRDREAGDDSYAPPSASGLAGCLSLQFELEDNSSFSTVLSHHIASRFASMCYQQPWQSKIAAAEGITACWSTLDFSTPLLMNHQIEFIRGLLYALKDMPTESSLHTDVISQALIQVLQLTSTSEALSSLSESEASNAIMSVKSLLIMELPSQVATVRATVRKACHALADVRGESLSDLLMPVRDRLSSTIFTKPLRALGFAIQIGYMDAVAYGISLSPPLFDADEAMSRLLLEALGIADADDSALIGGRSSGTDPVSSAATTGPKTVAPLTQLRVACIQLLNVTLQRNEVYLPGGETRQRVLAVFFKQLYSRASEVVDAAFIGLRDYMNSQGKLERPFLQLCLKPALQSFAGDPRKLTIAQMQSLARLLELLPAYFRSEMGEKLFQVQSVPWSDKEEQVRKLIETNSLSSAMPFVDSDQTMKLLAAATSIYPLLLKPHCASVVPKLLTRVVDTHKLMRKADGRSLLTDPVRTLVNAYPSETFAYFKEHAHDPAVAALFCALLPRNVSRERQVCTARDASSVLPACFLETMPREKLSATSPRRPFADAHVGAFKDFLLGLDAEAWESLAPTDAQDDTFLNIARLWLALIDGDDAAAFASREDIRSLVQRRWRSQTRKERLSTLGAPYFAQLNEDRTLLLLLQAFVKAKFDVSLLFDSFDLFTHSGGLDRLKHLQFVDKNVCFSRSVDMKKAIVNAFLPFLDNANASVSHKVFILRDLVNPILLVALSRLPERSTLVDAELANGLHERIWQPESPLSSPTQPYVSLNSSAPPQLPAIFSDDMLVELLAMSTRVLKAGGPSSPAGEYRKDIVRWAWRCVRSEDVLFRHSAFVLVAQFAELFECPVRLIMQMYGALLKSHQPEAVHLSRAALDILLPILPERALTNRNQGPAEDLYIPPDTPGSNSNQSESGSTETSSSLPIWVAFTRRMLIDESSTSPAVLNILRSVTAHAELFRPHADTLVPCIMTALSNLSVSSSASDARKPTLAVLEVVLSWASADDASQAVASVKDQIVHILIRFLATSHDTPKSPSVKSALGLLSSFLRLPGWADASIKMVFFQRIFLHSQVSSDMPSVLNAVEALAIVCSAKPFEWVQHHASTVEGIVRQIFGWTDLKLHIASRPLLEPVMRIAIEQVKDSSDASDNDAGNDAGNDAMAIDDQKNSDPDASTQPSSENQTPVSSREPHILQWARHYIETNLRSSDFALSAILVLQSWSKLSPSVSMDFTAPLFKTLGRTVREHLTEDSNSDALRVMVNVLEILQANIESLGEQRKLLLSAFSTLIDKSSNTDLLRFILQVLRRWVLEPDFAGRAVPTASEKAALVARMASFEHRAPSLLKDVLTFVYDIFASPEIISGTNMAMRLEPVFMLGVKSSDPSMRSRFLDLLNGSLPRSLHSRLYYVLGQQSWSALASSYWIPQAMELLVQGIIEPLPIWPKAHAEQDANESAGPNAVVTLDKSLASEKPQRVRRSSRSTSRGRKSESRANSARDGTSSPGRPSKRQKRSTQDTPASASPGEPEAPAVPAEISASPAKFASLAPKFLKSDFAVTIARLGAAHGPTTQSTWANLFSAAWAACSRREQLDLNRFLIALVAKDYQIKGASLRPNAVQTLLVGALACSSAGSPLFPPPLLRYAAKTFNAWYTCLELLQNAATDARESPEWRDNVQDALASTYADLAEDDFFYGLWRRRAQYLETNAALSYEQLGRWSSAQQLYEAALIKGKTLMSGGGQSAMQVGQSEASARTHPLWSTPGEAHAALPTDSELALWEDHWVLAAQKQQQWDILIDLARQENNRDLFLESAWRLSDWSLEKDAISTTLKQSHPFTLRRRLFNSFMTLLSDEKRRSVDLSHIFEVDSQMTLDKWHTLPEHIAGAHAPLLHTLQYFVELSEAQSIFHSLSKTNTANLDVRHAEVKTTLQAWRERLPNTFEDLNFWSDLVSFRDNIFSAISRVYAPLVPAQTSDAGDEGRSLSFDPQTQTTVPPPSTPQSILANRGYHEAAWITNRFAHVLRKHNIERDTCIAVLTKIYSLPNIEIQEAFLKLKEQAKCSLRGPKPDSQAGLETIHNTHLMFFTNDQKSVFLTLKGIFLSQLKFSDEANLSFNQGVLMDMSSPFAWAEWAAFLDLVVHKRDPALNTAAAANAVAAYLQAAGLYNNHRARKLLVRILWLMHFDDASRQVHNAFEQYSGEHPVWYWIALIPQLIPLVMRPEKTFARQIFVRIVRSYPQAVFFYLKATRDDLTPLRKRSEASKAARVHAAQGSANGNEQEQQQSSGTSGVEEKPAESKDVHMDGSEERSSPQRDSSSQSVAHNEQLSEGSGEANGNQSQEQPTAPAPDGSESQVQANVAETRVGDATGETNSTPATGSTPVDGAPAQPTAQPQAPWAFIEEMILILKTTFPLLALSMELAVDQIVTRFKSTPDEDTYRLVTMLLSETLGLLVNRAMAHTQPDAPTPVNEMPVSQSAIANNVRVAKSLVPPAIRDDFEREFCSPNMRMKTYIDRLCSWRDHYESLLLHRPRSVSMERASHFFVEFQYLKQEEIEVPGQYFNMTAADNSHFIRIRTLAPFFQLTRVQGFFGRVITFIGHDASEHSFLIQTPPHRHVRREERLQQLVRLMNAPLDSSVEARRRGLTFHVPQAVSISHLFRIVPMHASQISLQSIYERHCIRHGFQRELPIFAYTERLLALNRAHAEKPYNRQEIISARLSVFEEIAHKLIPDTILKNFLCESLVNPSDLWFVRKQFSLDTAAFIALSYMFFLDKRVPNRLFVDRSTGRFHTTDILPNFAPNKAILASSESVPFRFSPNMQALVSPVGTEGVVAPAVVLIADALTRSDRKLEYLLPLFIRDEVAFCTAWSKGIPPALLPDLPSPQLVYQGTVTNVAEIMKRARLIACQYERSKPPSAMVPANESVLELLSQSTNPLRLSQLDALWMPCF